MSASSPSAHECIPSEPMDLQISSLAKCPLTQSSLRKSLPSKIPLAWSPACQRLMQRRCSLTAFSVSSVTRDPLPFSNRPTLFLGFSKYSNNKRKTFLFSLMMLARFSSRWALATQHQYLGHRHLENIYQYCGVSVEASPLLGCW